MIQINNVSKSFHGTQALDHLQMHVPKGAIYGLVGPNGAGKSTIMVVVPVNNTLLYVESIYQTMLNEESKIPMLKKVVVASGNKVAIGDNLDMAVKNLLSKEASSIEVENTDDIDGLLDAIVKANKNLSESTNNKDWELMGSDIKKLQSLIDSLEAEKAKEDKKKEETKKEVNEVNNVIENIVE